MEGTVMELVKLFKHPIKGRNPMILVLVKGYLKGGAVIGTFPYRRGSMEFVMYPARGIHYSS